MMKSLMMFDTEEDAQVIKQELEEHGFEDVNIKDFNYETRSTIQKVFCLFRDVPSREPYKNEFRRLFLRTNSQWA